MNKLATVSMGIVLGLLLVATCRADLVVFGDSLSDTGNTLSATSGLIPSSSSGYFQGRFTNGKSWHEHVATFLGQPEASASRLGGTNYAHGGAEVLSSGFLQPSLADQVAGVGVIRGADLHVIWAGGNDLLSVDLDGSIDQQRLRSRQIAAGINASIDTLYSRGARDFLVLNVPDLGLLPLMQATQTTVNLEELTDLTSNFNRELAQEMRKARDDNSEVNIVEIDVHTLFQGLIADPAEFGITNTTDAATEFDTEGSAFFPAGLATAQPGAGIDPDEYLFYDGLHPTARAHQLLADHVVSTLSVPEPSQFAGLLVGFVAVSGWLTIRKRVMKEQLATEGLSKEQLSREQLSKESCA